MSLTVRITAVQWYVCRQRVSDGPVFTYLLQNSMLLFNIIGAFFINFVFLLHHSCILA